MNNNPELTVLAQQPIHSDNYLSSNHARYRLPEFHGEEVEDYRHFRKGLEAFFALSDITKESRKILILQTQLQHGARIFFNTLYNQKTDITKCTYTEFADALNKEYITPRLIRRYQLAFNSMMQGNGEPPRIFLGRLKEAATLANINDSSVIEIRFQMGLVPEIITHCKLMGANTYDDYVKYADSYWDAYSITNISIVDSPFNMRSVSSSLVPQKDQSTVSSHANCVDKVMNKHHPVSFAHALVNQSMEYPTIQKLTKQMETLQLNHMESNQVPSDSEVFNSNTKLENTIRMMVEETIKKHLPSYNNNNRYNQNYDRKNGRNNRNYYNNDYRNDRESNYNNRRNEQRDYHSDQRRNDEGYNREQQYNQRRNSQGYNQDQSKN
jgi:hypothetical protein